MYVRECVYVPTCACIWAERVSSGAGVRGGTAEGCGEGSAGYAAAKPGSPSLPDRLSDLKHGATVSQHRGCCLQNAKEASFYPKIEHQKKGCILYTGVGFFLSQAFVSETEILVGVHSFHGCVLCTKPHRKPGTLQLRTLVPHDQTVLPRANCEKSFLLRCVFELLFLLAYEPSLTSIHVFHRLLRVVRAFIVDVGISATEVRVYFVHQDLNRLDGAIRGKDLL